MRYLKPFILCTSVFVLYGCGGGDSASVTPTEPNTEFNLTLTVGPTATESYSLSGTDSLGNNYILVVSSQTGSETTFLGETVIPLFTNMETTLVEQGSTDTVSGTEYYKVEANGSRYIGNSVNTTTVSSTSDLIPLTAEIGDFGTVGMYIDNAGFTEVITWELDDGGDGNALLIFSFEEKNELDVIVSSTVQTYLIQPDGTPLSLTLKKIDFESDVSFELTTTPPNPLNRTSS